MLANFRSKRKIKEYFSTYLILGIFELFSRDDQQFSLYLIWGSIDQKGDAGVMFP